MSLLALLTAKTVPVDPEPPTSPAPSDVLNLAYSDPISDAARPAWQHIIRVGPTRDIKTVADGVLAATRTGYATPGLVPQPTGLGILSRGGRQVYARTLVLLDPGVYTLDKINDAGSGIDLMGNGDSRGDVVIRTNGTGDVRYALRMWGSVYVANLTLKLEPGAQGNNYPMHGSEIPGTQHFTCVFDNVHFLESNPTAYGIAGWDMPDGMRAYHYRCRFESTTGKGIIYHDMPLNTQGVGVYLIRCEIDVDFPWSSNKGRSVAYECTTLTGTPRPSMEQVNSSDWAPYTGPMPSIPAKAITDAEKAKYVPIAVGGAIISPAYGTITRATPVSRRTYYVPLGARLEAAMVKSLRLGVSSGAVSVGLYYGTADQPQSSLILTRFQTGTGNLEFLDRSDARVFMERSVGWQFWLGIRTNGDAVVDCSATVAGALYEDTDNSWGGVLPGASPAVAPVPPGAPVPAPVIVAQ